MMNKKRRINLTKKDFDKKLKFVKEFCEIKYNEEPKIGIGSKAYIIDKISNEHVYFNEDGTVKETNYKRKYDYFIAGMSCYDDEYPTHR